MVIASQNRHLVRAARVQATRQRVVEAAVPLFVDHGYLDTTMSAIAKAAGVAVQTLYLSFGSKAAVLEAALVGGGEDHPDGWLDRLRAESDGPAALAGHVAVTAAAVARRYPLAAVLRAAAADPEPAELLTRSRRSALAGHARAVDELAEKSGFTHLISVQRATEIVATLLSPENCGLLVAGYGWPATDWADWAYRHAVADLFPA